MFLRLWQLQLHLLLQLVEEHATPQSAQAEVHIVVQMQLETVFIIKVVDADFHTRAAFNLVALVLYVNIMLVARNVLKYEKY